MINRIKKLLESIDEDIYTDILDSLPPIYFNPNKNDITKILHSNKGQGVRFIVSPSDKWYGADALAYTHESMFRELNLKVDYIHNLTCFLGKDGVLTVNSDSELFKNEDELRNSEFFRNMGSLVNKIIYDNIRG